MAVTTPILAGERARTEAIRTGNLQLTWTGTHMFVWSRNGPVQDALAELSGLPRSVPAAARFVAIRRTRTLRAQVEGLMMTVGDVLPVLSALPTDAPVSDVVLCWSLAAKLALELAVRKRVVPTVLDGHARWVAVLSLAEDRDRFDALVRALPNVGRSPVLDTGRGPLMPSPTAMRAFVNAAVDHLFRSGAYPGPARGWTLDFAQALRAPESRFVVRDARSQATPDRIAAWAGRAEAPIPRVGFALDLPDKSDGRFPLRILLHRPGDPRCNAPIDIAWKAGRELELGGEALYHPAESAIRGLARAARLYPPLAATLSGAKPKDLRLDGSAAWSFLDEGRAALEAGGFSVLLPPAFERAGRQRIRARIRLGLAGPAEKGKGSSLSFDLNKMLSYRWEVLIGDQILDGPTFTRLCAENRRIVLHQGEWVFLDPDELARLPKDLSMVGQLSAPEALRAVLTGEHLGVPVVADERLTLVLQALRDPPDLPSPTGLLATLRPYQARGYAWLSALGALGLGALLADDMGLGKSVQLIAYLLGRRSNPHHEGRPTLIVCPTSVLGNWQREIARFAPSLRVLRWHGLDREQHLTPTLAREYDVVLTTYGLLVRDSEVLSAQQWDVAALDEAQSIKNPDSRRARCARRLSARHRVALTGTPVENRLDELWSVMEYLVPGLLGTRATFSREIAVPIERFGDSDVAMQLKRTVAPFLLRRSKRDPTVIDDLPDKVERKQYVVLTDEQRALYEEEVERAMAEISGSSDLERRGRILAMLTALKQICNHPYQFLKRHGTGPPDATLPGRSGKLERVTEIVEEIASCGERAVLFTQYREMGDLLQNHLSDILKEPVPFLHGGTPAFSRDEMVRQFQSDEGELAPTVLIVSLKAGGTGLSLTAATHVIHYDRWWNPAVEDQATDRAHRIGQRHAVLVHKLVCEGTLEERIDAVLDEKRELFDAVVGSGEKWATELDDDALLRLVLLSDPTAGGRERSSR
jgi:hypothetical protein